MGTLIIPCAGRSTRFPGVRPKWLLTYPDGKLMVQKSLEGLDIKSLQRTIITVVKEHCDKYDADIIINQAFGDSVEVCILDNFTKSQSETISLTIDKMNVEGGFIAKDSDGRTDININEINNFLVGVKLENHMELTNVAGKSFIILDGNNIKDIIEKQVLSNIINIGVYGFENADNFKKLSNELNIKNNYETFLSHIVSHMLKTGKTFEYKEANNYEDWGLMSDWIKAKDKQKTYFVDIDGVIFKNKGRYGRINWNDTDVPLKENIYTLKKLVDNGAQIIITTARPENQRIKLIKSLKLYNLPYDNIIMDCNHAQRVIINDHSTTNPYPSCKAISIKRDSDDLKDYINE